MWSKVTVEDFVEIQSIELTEYSSVLSYNVERISILEGKEVEEYDELSMAELTALLSQYKWLDKQPSKHIAPELNDLHYKGVRSVTLGEYIDLDHFYSENYFTNLPIMCAILYRKKKVNEWENEIIEPYIYNPHERKELFYDIPITDVYGVLSEWATFKEYIQETYANVFEQPIEGEEDTKDLTPEERKDLEKEIQQEKKLTKWGWERIIHKLANEDITKYSQVLDLNFIFVMNNLSMRMDLDI